MKSFNYYKYFMSINETILSVVEHKNLNKVMLEYALECMCISPIFDHNNHIYIFSKTSY